MVNFKLKTIVTDTGMIFLLTADQFWRLALLRTTTISPSHQGGLIVSAQSMPPILPSPEVPSITQGYFLRTPYRILPIHCMIAQTEVVDDLLPLG